VLPCVTMKVTVLKKLDAMTMDAIHGKKTSGK
jgi:hypothetical protein